MCGRELLSDNGYNYSCIALVELAGGHDLKVTVV